MKNRGGALTHALIPLRACVTLADASAGMPFLTVNSVCLSESDGQHGLNSAKELNKVLAQGFFRFHRVLLDEVVKLSRGTRRIKVHDACLAIIVE